MRLVYLKSLFTHYIGLTQQTINSI